jgi:hypothetical protein
MMFVAVEVEDTTIRLPCRAFDVGVNGVLRATAGGSGLCWNDDADGRIGIQCAPRWVWPEENKKEAAYSPASSTG